MRRLFTLLTLVLVFLTLFSLSGEAAKAQGPEEGFPPIDRASFRHPTAEVLQLEGQLRSDVETRLSLGLNADITYVQTLRGLAQDVGSREVNIPMTQAEYNEFQERTAFASEAANTVLPYVQTLPTFAGAFFDHSARGELVILLTQNDAGVRGRINSLVPKGRATRVEIVPYTENQLRAALKAVWEEWKKVGGPELYAVAVDTPANAVRVEVDAVNLDTAQELVAEVGPRVGVPLFAVPGVQAIETACTNRSNCSSPMKAGILIKQGTSSIAICTMGFHVIKDGDTQFLTAGHCGYTLSSNSWYHDGYGTVGVEQATRYYNGGSDIMRVQMSDTQGSASLYSSAYPVSAAQHPYTGMTVCADLGNSNVWSCGSVSASYISWTGAACNCTIYGGDTTISAAGGDSGSPIVSGTITNNAVGIMVTADGGFARVKDALDAWGGWVTR